MKLFSCCPLRTKQEISKEDISGGYGVKTTLDLTDFHSMAKSTEVIFEIFSLFFSQKIESHTGMKYYNIMSECVNDMVLPVYSYESTVLSPDNSPPNLIPLDLNPAESPDPEDYSARPSDSVNPSDSLRSCGFHSCRRTCSESRSVPSPCIRKPCFIGDRQKLHQGGSRFFLFFPKCFSSSGRQTTTEQDQST